MFHYRQTIKCKVCVFYLGYGMIQKHRNQPTDKRFGSGSWLRLGHDSDHCNTKIDTRVNTR